MLCYVSLPPFWLQHPPKKPNPKAPASRSSNASRKGVFGTIQRVLEEGIVERSHNAVPLQPVLQAAFGIHDMAKDNMRLAGDNFEEVVPFEAVG